MGASVDFCRKVFSLIVIIINFLFFPRVREYGDVGERGIMSAALKVECGMFSGTPFTLPLSTYKIERKRDVSCDVSGMHVWGVGMKLDGWWKKENGTGNMTQLWSSRTLVMNLLDIGLVTRIFLPLALTLGCKHVEYL